MNAWSGEGDVLGPTVTRAGSAKPDSPPLKNGNDLKETGYLIAVGSRSSRFRRKHKQKLTLIVIIIILIMILCFAIVMTILYALQKHHKPIRICENKECLRSAANLALSMDKTADPCEDFYQYACGNWAEDHPRPDAYLSYDWFRAKQGKVYAAVRDFLTSNSSNQPRPVQQAKDMYSACMDTVTLDKLGLKPVFNILSSLGLPPYPTFVNATDDIDYDDYNFDWLETVITIKTQLGMDILIGFDIFSDPKNSSSFTLAMGTPETVNPFPGLKYRKKRHSGNLKTPGNFNKAIIRPLFDTNQKIDDDEKDKDDEIYNIIYAELIKLFVIDSGGLKKTKLTEVELDVNILSAKNEYISIKNDIYELETDNTTETEDDEIQDVPRYTVEEIQTHTDSNVEHNNGTVTPIWKRYLEGIFNISDVTLDFDKDKISVSDPDLKYMALMAAYISKTPPVVIELYIWIKIVEVMAVHTTTELRNLFRRIYEQEHSGYQYSSRSLLCASAVNEMLGMAVSYGIADPYFFNVTKPKIERMLHELKNALAHLVGQAKWMDDDTKLATYKKIIQMKSLIGFPDWLLEDGKLDEYYKGIQIDTKKHLENMINIIQIRIRRGLNGFRDVNNFTWATEPTEVNAYHTFQHNTITIPMVVLQHPFFDLGLDSLNYGSLGAVLGHEITHGFDNFGRYFDKNGNILPWWTNETIELFENKTQCFVHQYSAYYLPELDKHVDGKMTLGENIADNGGVREALAALKEHLRKSGPEEKLPGFEHMTSEQLFFLAYGNLWCGVSTKESLEADLEDEHSPQHFRAKGALQNMADFSRAWRCPVGSNMNPEQKCIIY